jgi:glycosyltransferase involved in cell wall biosynthesis
MIFYVVTPTFNRKDELVRLFKSLDNQTVKEFHWLIVDDGSTDNTSRIVDSFILESSFPIHYINKNNGGKHTAYNTAISYMGTEGYHVVVDSDDYLFENSISTFLDDIKVAESRGNIGTVYPRTNNILQNKWLPDNIESVDIPDIKHNFNLNIETCIVISNSAVNGFQFPVFEGERFMSEEALYYYLISKGSFLPINKEVYYFEYLDDGWTKNVFKIWKNNINSTLYSLSLRKNYILQRLKGKQKVVELLKVKLNINSLYLFKRDFSNYTPIDFVMLPLTWVFYKYRFNK